MDRTEAESELGEARSKAARLREENRNLDALIAAAESRDDSREADNFRNKRNGNETRLADVDSDIANLESLLRSL